VAGSKNHPGWGIEGADYEIDLNGGHAGELRQTLSVMPMLAGGHQGDAAPGSAGRLPVWMPKPAIFLFGYRFGFGFLRVGARELNYVPRDGGYREGEVLADANPALSAPGRSASEGICGGL
jgi:hypothetical protein